MYQRTQCLSFTGKIISSGYFCIIILHWICKDTQIAGFKFSQKQSALYKTKKLLKDSSVLHSVASLGKPFILCLVRVCSELTVCTKGSRFPYILLLTQEVGCLLCCHDDIDITPCACARALNVCALNISYLRLRSTQY